MLKISGIAPEDLPVADNIKKAERRLKNEQNSIPHINQQSSIEPTTFFEVEEVVMDTRDVSTDDRKPIDLRKDLWKFALLLIATRPDSKISTSELIAELYSHPRG